MTFDNNAIPEPPKRYGVSNRPVILANSVITIIGIGLIIAVIFAPGLPFLGQVLIPLVIAVLMGCAYIVINVLQKTRILTFGDRWWLQVASPWFRKEHKIFLTPFDLKRLYQGIPVRASGEDDYVLIRTNKDNIVFLEYVSDLSELYHKEGYAEEPRFSIATKTAIEEKAFISRLPFEDRMIYYTNAGKEVKGY